MASKMEAFCQVVEHLVTHWRHGYSQPGRYGDGTTEWVDTCIGRVQIAGGDRDCSSCVETAAKAVGLPTGRFYYTGNAAGLGEAGWTWHPPRDAKRRGDVLYYHRYGNVGHMAVHLGGGKLAEFYLSETGGIDGRVGDQNGWESRIADYYDPGWDGFYRWENDEEEEDDMTPEQDKMLREVHGMLTDPTATAAQEETGQRVDTGARPLARLPYIEGRLMQLLATDASAAQAETGQPVDTGATMPARLPYVEGRIMGLQADQRRIEGKLDEVLAALKAK